MREDAVEPRGEVLWAPPTDVWSTTAAGRFAVEHGYADYAALHQWSVTDREGFWTAAARACGVRWRDEPSAVSVGTTMPDVRWFPGGTLNYAEHALAPAAVRPDEIAVVARSQTRDGHELTWRDLATAVAAPAAGLRALGVRPGDRVVAYAPNIVETLVAFLAAASIGAPWSSCAPEFGVRSVIDRFAQIAPVVLVAVDGYRYGDEAIDRSAEVTAIVAALPSLRHVVHVPYLHPGRPVPAMARPTITWSGLVADRASPLTFDALPADHPLYVLFSSGTTGLPKAIVHGHGGIVAEHLKVLTLHQDLRPGDRFCWFTTTGWMMWNYLVSGLAVGAAIVLFDGDPGWPSLDTLWDLAAETSTTVLGVSAPFLMSCRKAGVTPHATREGAALRWVGSTGAPLPAAGFRWVHEQLGVPVSSISGGTDVCTAFVGSSPLVPVRAGEISCALLGCAVEAYAADGRPCPPGVTGELVVTAPMPSMPVGFWGDDDGSRLRAAYFDDHPGVWRHGDWITFTDDGACVVSGRSDATLNRGGVRLGTSDFYAVVEAFAEITDSLVVHLDDDGPDAGGLGRLLLFVVLAQGVDLDDALVGRLRAALRSELSPRHLPDSIEAVPAVPRTLSGKKLEVPVKRILSGAVPDDAASRGALVDPGALDWYVRRATGRPS
ncbi:MAG: acetoacetate--CoA ligase [Ilumatobacteraceae bacterium]